MKTTHTMEIDVKHVGQKFVHGFTPENCKGRADQLYGKGRWKEVETKETRDQLCQRL